MHKENLGESSKKIIRPTLVVFVSFAVNVLAYLQIPKLFQPR